MHPEQTADLARQRQARLRATAVDERRSVVRPPLATRTGLWLVRTGLSLISSRSAATPVTVELTHRVHDERRSPGIVVEQTRTVILHPAQHDRRELVGATR